MGVYGLADVPIVKLQLRLWLLTSLFATPVFASRQEAFIGYSEKQSDEVVLVTAHGQIHIALLDAVAPNTCKLALQLAQSGCQTCRFYRNEQPPKTGFGPPYGLLQGSLEGLSQIPPREETVVAKKGHVCMIPGTKEFFIAAKDHDEWGNAHTVWGMVRNLTTVERMLQLPFRTTTHPTYGTVMRMMTSEAAFDVKVEAGEVGGL